MTLAVSLLLVLTAQSLRAESAEATVERIRQLEFKNPVARKTIPRSELRAFLQKQIDADLPYEPKEYLEILRALHLLDGDDDSLDSLFELYEAQALAFYDPRTHVYYAMDAPEASAEALIADSAVEVHELMHALQDQRFGIGPKLDAVRLDWDAAMAYQALLEGEATLVMMAALYADMGLDFDTIINDEAFLGLLSAAAAESAGIPEGTPAYYVQSMTFPYVDGLKFVVHAYREGGWKALDRLHANPPRSTEEILHPELYRERPHQAEGMTAGVRKGSPILATQLGEFHWKFLLGEEAAEGWADDRIEVRRGEGSSFTVLGRTSWDSARDASEFAAALRTKLKDKGVSGDVLAEGTSVRYAYGPDTAEISRFLRPSRDTAAPAVRKK